MTHSTSGITDIKATNRSRVCWTLLNHRIMAVISHAINPSRDILEGKTQKLPSLSPTVEQVSKNSTPWNPLLASNKRYLLFLSFWCYSTLHYYHFKLTRSFIFCVFIYLTFKKSQKVFSISNNFILDINYIPQVSWEWMKMAEEQDMELIISPQIHQKCIYMWNDSHRMSTERWQRISDIWKGNKISLYLGKTKEKKKRNQDGTCTLGRELWKRKVSCNLGSTPNSKEISWDMGNLRALKESVATSLQRLEHWEIRTDGHCNCATLPSLFVRW